MTGTMVGSGSKGWVNCLIAATAAIHHEGTRMMVKELTGGWMLVLIVGDQEQVVVPWIPLPVVVALLKFIENGPVTSGWIGNANHGVGASSASMRMQPSLATEQCVAKRPTWRPCSQVSGIRQSSRTFPSVVTDQMALPVPNTADCPS